MKRTFGILAGCAALALATAAFAQHAATKPPVFKVKDEVTLIGKVTDVKTIPDWMGKDGVNIALQNAELTAPHVDVATASFLQMFDFPIAAGDDLTLVGCWSDAADGTPVFLVQQLSKRRVTLNVRDPSGTPLW